jgi:hypothetical protein
MSGTLSPFPCTVSCRYGWSGKFLAFAFYIKKCIGKGMDKIVPALKEISRHERVPCT